MTFSKVGHVLLISALATAHVHAQEIVLDPMNLIENTITSIQSLSQYAVQAEQYLKQIDQLEEQIRSYETQLQQFATELQNTLSLPQFLWSDVSGVISKLQRRRRQPDRRAASGLAIRCQKSSANATSRPGCAGTNAGVAGREPALR